MSAKTRNNKIGNQETIDEGQLTFHAVENNEGATDGKKNKSNKLDRLCKWTPSCLQGNDDEDTLEPAGERKQNGKTERKSKGKTLQLYNPNDSTITTEFQIKFRKYLKKRRKVIRVDEPSTILKDIPLIVLCLNHSRIGTDIDYSLARLPDYNRNLVGIVVVHMTQKHALPQTLPTDNLIDEKYDGYWFKMDCFYTHEDGWYTCDLKNETKTRLEKDLKQMKRKVNAER